MLIAVVSGVMAPYSGSGGVKKVVHVGGQVKRRVMACFGVNGLRGYHRRHSLQVHSDLVPSLVGSALSRKIVISGCPCGVFGLCRTSNGGLDPMEIALFRGLWKSSPFSSRCVIAVEVLNVNGSEVIVVDPGKFGALLRSYQQKVKFENAFLEEAFGEMECGVFAAGGEGPRITRAFRVHTFLTIPSGRGMSYMERKKWCTSATLMVLQNFRDFIRGAICGSMSDSARVPLDSDVRESNVLTVKDDALLETDQMVCLSTRFDPVTAASIHMDLCDHCSDDTMDTDD